jgi:hypothetical protein
MINMLSKLVANWLKLRVYLLFFQLVAVQACAYCLGEELHRIKHLANEQSHNILREIFNSNKSAMSCSSVRKQVKTCGTYRYGYGVSKGWKLKHHTHTCSTCTCNTTVLPTPMTYPTDK